MKDVGIHPFIMLQGRGRLEHLGGGEFQHLGSVGQMVILAHSRSSKFSPCRH